MIASLWKICCLGAARRMQEKQDSNFNWEPYKELKENTNVQNSPQKK